MQYSHVPDSSSVEFTTLMPRKPFVGNIPSQSAFSLNSPDSIANNQLDSTGNGHNPGT